ncbi:HYC_CC_PP family protein [Mucilaginibacter segetis]|uniref:Uncharacterized protein n=1 Tax=Mucilaginibacter segetis TaxID=2793071 RepID=A0A934PVC6_9SPHI|nr:hypothetical protein [Mucilaginibacter segetis]MBK0379775.1 hypothetical protein [Mucilaginibacter segetis]
MIKRLGTVLLMLLYVVTASGFALNLHYCGNYVADVQINAPVKSCVQPMTEGKMKCCKDTHLTVKIKDDHQNEANEFLNPLFSFDIPRSLFGDLFLSPQRAQADKFYDRGPPDIAHDGLTLCIKNCIFRI